MSTPIKPPDGADAPDAAGLEPTDGATAVEGAPGEFKAVADAAAAATEIAGQLDAGAIDASQAVEQLVQRALANARGLAPAQQKALEAQLRAALADDPTLVALQEDLRAANG